MKLCVLLLLAAVVLADHGKIYSVYYYPTILCVVFLFKLLAHVHIEQDSEIK